MLHQNSGEVFRERSVIGAFGENFPFRQIDVKIILEDESTLLLALPCFHPPVVRGDQIQASSFQQGARLGGDRGLAPFGSLKSSLD